MIVQKYKDFQRFVRSQVPKNSNKPITEKMFDDFVSSILENKALDLQDKAYCRDGFAYIKELNRRTYQILAFQINTFGKGAFGDDILKLCTPILITVKTHSAHFYSGHTLKDTNLSFESFYLGKNYKGSKGELCDRERITRNIRELFINNQLNYSYRHEIVYKLINTNLICHHVAETLSYALGALDLFWYTKKNNVYLVSASTYLEKQKKLKIEILDNFSYERMKCIFDIPQYALINGHPERFREHYNLMQWEVLYKRERENFYLPAGYQKINRMRYNKAANVITTQHIVEYILNTYFKRMNPHVVTNTYQTLEYLSRVVLAKKEGRHELGMEFLKHASSCMGHYPDRDFEDLWQSKEKKYPMFISDYIHSMFFRPPVV